MLCLPMVSVVVAHYPLRPLSVRGVQLFTLGGCGDTCVTGSSAALS